jgi:hypothetical protein
MSNSMVKGLITEVAPWPPRTADVLQVNWLTRNYFCTVRYWSVCIYIVQINVYKKKKKKQKSASLENKTRV